MSSSKRALKDSNTEDDIEGLDVVAKEHLSKRMKEKEEEKVKLVTSRIIAVAGTEHKTSLKDIPGEIMDRIFCVRPEQECQDYVALAGSCKYFRERMNDDFWKSLCQEKCVSNVDLYRFPKTGRIPFNRSVPDWKVDRPRLMLPREQYVTTARRSESQWVSKVWPTEGPVYASMERVDQRAPYTLGHYVPKGSRSSWTKAQYTVYKEEQADWRRDRNLTRLKGLETMLATETHCDDEVGRYMSSLPGNIYVKIVKIIPAVGSGASTCSKPPGQSPNTGKLSYSVTKSMDSDLCHVDEARSRTPNFQVDSSSSEVWETPDSEASEDEDEYEWLRQRGFRRAHDCWPSRHRRLAVDSNAKHCFEQSEAMTRFQLNEEDLSSIKSYKVEWTVYKHRHKSHHSGVVWCPAALRAKAYKVHGGPEQFKVAMRHAREKQEAAEKLEKSMKRKEQRLRRKQANALSEITSA